MCADAAARAEGNKDSAIQITNVPYAEQWLLRFDRVASTTVAEVLALALECRCYFYTLAVGRFPPVHTPTGFAFLWSGLPSIQDAPTNRLTC